MLPLAGVEEDAVLLVGLHGEAEVDRGGSVERLQLHVGRGVDQLDCRQVLTSLSWKHQSVRNQSGDCFLHVF